MHYNNNSDCHSNNSNKMKLFHVFQMRCNNNTLLVQWAQYHLYSYLWMHCDVVRKRDKVDSLSGFTNIYWNLNGWRSDSLIETMAAWPSVTFALERSALCFVIHWEFKIRSRVIQMIQVMSNFIITERDSLCWLLFFVGIYELKW